jgi:NMD protein affecting ribosome stability and mRNA decay
MTVFRPPALCVRCGRRPREHETYLCARCLDDPRVRREALAIQRAAEGYLAQRRVAIERYHWAGGWGRE